MSAAAGGAAHQEQPPPPGGGERDAAPWTTVQGRRRREEASRGQAPVAVLDPSLWKGGNLTVSFELQVRFARLPGGARHSDLHSPVALAFGRLLAAYHESTGGEGTSTGAVRVHVAGGQAYHKYDAKSGCTTFHAHFIGTPALLQFLSGRLQGGFLHLPAPVDGPAALIVDGACLRRVRIVDPPMLWVEDHGVAVAALEAGWNLHVREFHPCTTPWMAGLPCAVLSRRAIEVTLALPSAAGLPASLHIDDDQGQRQVSMRVDVVMPQLPPPVCLANVVMLRQQGGLPLPPPLGPASGAGPAVLPGPPAAGPPPPLVPQVPRRSSPSTGPQRQPSARPSPPRQQQRSPAGPRPPARSGGSGGSGGGGRQQRVGDSRAPAAVQPSAARSGVVPGSRFAVLAVLATDDDAALPPSPDSSPGPAARGRGAPAAPAAGPAPAPGACRQLLSSGPAPAGEEARGGARVPPQAGPSLTDPSTCAAAGVPPLTAVAAAEPPRGREAALADDGTAPPALPPAAGGAAPAAASERGVLPLVPGAAAAATAQPPPSLDAADAGLLRAHQSHRDMASALSPAAEMLRSRLVAAAAAATEAMASRPPAAASPQRPDPPSLGAAVAAPVAACAASPPQAAGSPRAALVGAATGSPPLARSHTSGRPATGTRRFTPNIPPPRPRTTLPGSLPSTPTRSRAPGLPPGDGAVAAVTSCPVALALPVAPAVSSDPDGRLAKPSTRASTSKATAGTPPPAVPSPAPTPAAPPSQPRPADSVPVALVPLTRQQSAAASRRLPTSSASSSRGPSPAPAARETQVARRSAPSVPTGGARR